MSSRATTCGSTLPTISSNSRSRCSSKRTTPRSTSSTYLSCQSSQARIYSPPVKNPRTAMIDLYAAGTFNGTRARIALEECGLTYKLHPIDLPKGEHKTPQFLAMNPMGQIPVMVDSDGPGGK